MQTLSMKEWRLFLRFEGFFPPFLRDAGEGENNTACSARVVEREVSVSEVKLCLLFSVCKQLGTQEFYNLMLIFSSLSSQLGVDQ